MVAQHSESRGQEAFLEFGDILAYTVSFRTARLKENLSRINKTKQKTIKHSVKGMFLYILREPDP